jgi:hypothetical protein
MTGCTKRDVVQRCRCLGRPSLDLEELKGLLLRLSEEGRISHVFLKLEIGGRREGSDVEPESRLSHGLARSCAHAGVRLLETDGALRSRSGLGFLDGRQLIDRSREIALLDIGLRRRDGVVGFWVDVGRGAAGRLHRTASPDR